VQDQRLLPQPLQSVRPRLTPAVATLTLLIGLNLLNYIDRYILPGELSLVQRDFHATDQRFFSSIWSPRP
jgi:hypothetical protein